MPKISVIFNTFFFSALLFNLMILKLFEKTIIQLEIVGFFYAVGILAFILFKNKLKKIGPWNSINNFIFCFFVVGSYLTLSVLSTNYYFSEKETENRTYEIVRKTEIIGTQYNRHKKKPAVIIEAQKGDTKRIEFPRNMKAKVDAADFVELELSKGLLNFDIIRHTKLK